MAGTRWYPNLTHLDQATQDAIRKLYDGMYAAEDKMSAIAVAHNQGLAETREANDTAQQLQQQVSSLPSFDVLASGTSTQLKIQSSALPAHCTPMVAVITPTGVTFYWDGTNGSSQIQIAWPDGSVTKVPLASLSVSGLTPGTTYNFYPAYNTGLNVIQFAPPNAPTASAVGTPAVAYSTPSVLAAAAADGDRLQSLYTDGVNGISITTPATGTATQTVGGK
jgi:hypothetical protein